VLKAGKLFRTGADDRRFARSDTRLSDLELPFDELRCPPTRCAVSIGGRPREGKGFTTARQATKGRRVLPRRVRSGFALRPRRRVWHTHRSRNRVSGSRIGDSRHSISSPDGDRIEAARHMYFVRRGRQHSGDATRSLDCEAVRHPKGPRVPARRCKFPAVTATQRFSAGLYWRTRV